MANFRKAANKRLGSLPQREKKGGNVLDAPESAPARAVRGKTGRTVSFNTKVTPEFDEEFRRTAFESKLKLVELLEICFDLYKKQNSKKGKR